MPCGITQSPLVPGKPARSSGNGRLKVVRDDIDHKRDGPLSLADEVHVSSLVVQVRPEGMATIRERIERLPGAEVHAAEAGKIVVTLETDGERPIRAAIETIHSWPGVLGAALVFHHVEPRASMETGDADQSLTP